MLVNGAYVKSGVSLGCHRIEFCDVFIQFRQVEIWISVLLISFLSQSIIDDKSYSCLYGQSYGKITSEAVENSKYRNSLCLQSILS